jgi:two-component system, OmpR family, phosphate regulon sensor histidine kinase PhoR
MARGSRTGISRSRLATLLGLLFLALAVPTAVLLVQTQRQIKFESFYQYRTLADELGLRIDAELQRMIAAEEARGYADYRFVVVAGDPATSNFVQRSPLARLPVQAEIPGVIGYFQVGAEGEFSTPAVPEDLSEPAHWGLDAAELAQRTALRDRLLDVLRRNQLLERHAEIAAAIPLAKQAKDSPGVAAAKEKKTAAGNRNAAESSTAAPLANSSIKPEVVTSVDADKNVAQREVHADAERSARPIASQAAFDQLNTVDVANARNKRNELGKVDDLRIAKNFPAENPPQAAQQQAPAYEQKLRANMQARATRKEQSAVVEPPERQRNVSDGSMADKVAATAQRVHTFESELDPFEFSLLDDGHGVLFRKVWRDGRRTIQGAILDQKVFIDGTITRLFEETALAQVSDMVVAYRHDVLQVARAGEAGYAPDTATQLQGELLHQLRLSAPLGDFELLWNIKHLPVGPGGRIVNWAGAVLFLVLVLGFVALYRLGLRQIMLARQQQDFVSAVSHELNTPLTSIRMYAEILREGWSGEDKKREYYAYIHDESERLSRLIANVLQLARMERNELRLELKPVRVTMLMDLLRSKLSSQVERAHFECSYLIDAVAAEREVSVDADAFVQIVINLVDNAIKFAAKAPRRAIDVGVRMRGDTSVVFSVRDYGPGVEKSQMRKIFALFYRAGNELTRDTLGTGIGLALVRQLARAMHGEADVIQCDPGAEFLLTLPANLPTSGRAAAGYEVSAAP